VFVKDPLRDSFADGTPLLADALVAPMPAFAGDRAIEHLAFVGHPDFFGARPLDELVLSFDLESTPGGGAASQIAWSLWNGHTALPLEVAADETGGLTHSGVVRFRDVPTAAAAAVNNVESRWLRAEARTVLAAPVIVRSLTMERAIAREGLPPDAALTNGAPVDVTKDFQPLGDRPAIGDVFYLAHRDAFSLSGATVTLAFTVSGGAAAAPAVELTKQAMVLWEYWNGATWIAMGTGRSSADVLNDVNGFSDTTRALTRDGHVVFHVPDVTHERVMAGTLNYWVRARLIAGGYGEEAKYVPQAAGEGAASFSYTPATLAAPSVRSLTISYALAGPGTSTRPEVVLGYNDFDYTHGTAAVRTLRETFTLLRRTGERRAALYLGFQQPSGATLPVAAMSLYIGVDDRALQVSTGYIEPKEPVMVWEYDTPPSAAAPAAETSTWRRLPARDRTRALTRSATIDLLLPREMQKTRHFGYDAFWVRLVSRAAPTARLPTIRRLRLNTVEAIQTATFRDEILGSSNGTASQSFRISRGGILEGPVLDVFESPDPLSPRDGSGWTAWTEVADFHGSRPTDRHYVMDHVGGTIAFGDGTHGRIPPAGLNNVRLTRSRTGGGAIGNVPPRVVVQLRTAVPYVERVENSEAASGGADGETLEEVRQRAPAVLRHQHRAVTSEDFEDLAMLASPEIARARCVPPAADGRPRKRGDAVTAVVVPKSTTAKPLPAIDLLDRVHAYLSERQNPAVQLVVRGPEYVAIDVDVDLVVGSLERVSEIDAAVARVVARFLDPLLGGPAGKGWEFGRVPHRSDFFSLVGSVDGVDYVRSVTIAVREDRPGLLATTAFLICVGAVRAWFYTE